MKVRRAIYQYAWCPCSGGKGARTSYQQLNMRDCSPRIMHRLAAETSLFSGQDFWARDNLMDRTPGESPQPRTEAIFGRQASQSSNCFGEILPSTERKAVPAGLRMKTSGRNAADLGRNCSVGLDLGRSPDPGQRTYRQAFAAIVRCSMQS